MFVFLNCTVNFVFETVEISEEETSQPLTVKEQTASPIEEKSSEPVVVTESESTIPEESQTSGTTLSLPAVLDGMSFH